MNDNFSNTHNEETAIQLNYYTMRLPRDKNTHHIWGYLKKIEKIVVVFNHCHIKIGLSCNSCSTTNL